jgi:beta-xylosidase
MAALMMTAMTWAQGVLPLPSLHVEGKWLVDSHGNHVVLHGVMDTPSAWFNNGRWGWSYDDAGRQRCLEYFEKLFKGLETAKCTVFRLHLEPAWTNDPNSNYTYPGSVGQPAGTDGEANISKFNPTRLTNYMKTLYFPLAKRAMKHGQYVVMRPPGVCPGTIKVGDYYNNYLMEVWDIVTKNDSILKYSGQISIELANEPVDVKNANGQSDPKAMHDFFQPIVEKIRANGFTGIIWIPGAGWQSQYADYAKYPIEGYNIGYAVHDYDGWYGCEDKKLNESNVEQAAQNKIRQFHNQVPVVDTNPIIITEVDWSPKNPGSGHYNEHNEWVESNYGTWATGRTSMWGRCFKAVHDYYGNISMTLSGTSCLIDVDQLLKDGSVVPAFGGLEEACGKACMDWYAEYYQVNWPHADFANISMGDQGNGKYKNPVVYGDFPDPDVICVDGTYYMVSTTMHNFPGATILKSTDLVNWEYCAQPLTQTSDDSAYLLGNNGSAYGSCMWACSMKYHNGKFYILINEKRPVDGWVLQGWLLTATNPEGTWTAKKLSRSYYDPGMLFDNGKVYVAQGIGNISVCELDENFNFKQEKGVISNKDGLEGSHFYKVGDYYYIYATYGGWPSGQVAFRSKNVFGPYEEKMLLEKTINNKPNTIHQGALIETPEGEWWTILQEDLGALGRFPNLQPVKWVDDWPIIGNNGKPVAVTGASGNNGSYAKPKAPAIPRKALPTNDNFRSYPLGMQWEWNHKPNDDMWSLFERQGWLRMRPVTVTDNLPQARNILTQRIFAIHGKESQRSTGTVKVDVSNLKEGERAGICILQDPYAMIAVEKQADGKYQIIWKQDKVRDAGSSFTPDEKRKAITPTDGIVYLRAAITKSTDKTQFYYSLDNKTYSSFGGQTQMSFNLSVFVGARFGIFCHATKEGSKGYADFDWFSTESKYEEDMFYPSDFEGFNEDMVTAEQLTMEGAATEVMVGGSNMLKVIATYRDGHTANVAMQASYEVSNPSVIEVEDGRIRGLKEGSSKLRVTYADPLGHELSQEFTVHSTYFPFGSEYINTNIVGEGTYDEEIRTFRPGQNGQMGWKYNDGANFADYKYLVIKLKGASPHSHLNIFTTDKTNGDCHSTAAFGTKKQIIVNLQLLRYTSGSNKGKKADLSNIRMVTFWGNGSESIAVDEMYLTNNDDYSLDGIEDVVLNGDGNSYCYDLQGRPVLAPLNAQPSSLKKGIYIRNGKKVVVR